MLLEIHVPYGSSTIIGIQAEDGKCLTARNRFVVERCGGDTFKIISNAGEHTVGEPNPIELDLMRFGAEPCDPETDD